MSPAVLYMCGEDAPNGRIIQAMGGRFSTNAVFANEPVDLGTDATFEDLVPRIDDVLDLSDAKPRANYSS